MEDPEFDVENAGVEEFLPPTAAENSP